MKNRINGSDTMTMVEAKDFLAKHGKIGPGRPSRQLQLARKTLELSQNGSVTLAPKEPLPEITPAKKAEYVKPPMSNTPGAIKARANYAKLKAQGIKKLRNRKQVANVVAGNLELSSFTLLKNVMKCCPRCALPLTNLLTAAVVTAKDMQLDK